MTGQVVVVGSMNMDATVQVPQLPQPGETVLGDAVEYAPGGKGGNQAAAAAALLGTEHQVRMVGLVGDDVHGEALRADLKGRGVDVTDVRTVTGTATGVAMIAVDRTGENTIIVAPGANTRWTAEHLERITFHAGDVVLCQLEIPVPAVEHVVQQARAAGATVVLNAAPPQPLPAHLLDAVDLLVVNETEAAVLLGAVPSTPQELQRLAADRACAVVVTLGARGALACPSGGAAVAAPAFPVTPVSAVGAGDAFVGALAVELLGDRALPEAVRRANAVGALATTAPGARGHLADAAELTAFLERSTC